MNFRGIRIHPIRGAKAIEGSGPGAVFKVSRGQELSLGVARTPTHPRKSKAEQRTGLSPLKKKVLYAGHSGGRGTDLFELEASLVT